jgi:hypothetical protein
MTTLAANTPLKRSLGDVGEKPVIASDIIYEGAAVGSADAAGHARPLVAGDRFAGFAIAKADNSAGAAAAINVRYWRRGTVQLAVAGAVITDVGQPVYATDDATFVFSPVSASFIGVISRWVSSGVVEVDFGPEIADPYGDDDVRELVSLDKTLDVQDTGKTFYVDTDVKVITLPVTATALHCKIVNIGAFGTVLVAISPQAADRIQGPDLPGTENKDHLNTKATARRGDYVVLQNGHADGAIILESRGIWATEA